MSSVLLDIARPRRSCQASGFGDQVPAIDALGSPHGPNVSLGQCSKGQLPNCPLPKASGQGREVPALSARGTQALLPACEDV